MLRVKEILHTLRILLIYINDELQGSYWCGNGSYDCNLCWYLDCKVIAIKIKDSCLSLEVE